MGKGLGCRLGELSGVVESPGIVEPSGLVGHTLTVPFSFPANRAQREEASLDAVKYSGFRKR